MLEIFKSLDFSDSISIEKDIPPFKKILDGLDYISLLNEMNSFAIDDNKASSPWFSMYGIDIQTSLDELNSIGLTSGYQQWQMTQKQLGVPWQTWREEIGTKTRELFETQLIGFHRPRYVTVQPGWEVNNHKAWDNNYKLGLRCHLILDTNDDCIHYITDDTGVEHELHFKPGEVWFYDVSKIHRAKNSGNTVRKSISFELFNDDLL
jgi:hypothetical protein